MPGSLAVQQVQPLLTGTPPSDQVNRASGIGSPALSVRLPCSRTGTPARTVMPSVGLIRVSTGDCSGRVIGNDRRWWSETRRARSAAVADPGGLRSRRAVLPTGG